MKKIAAFGLYSILLICSICYGEYINNGDNTITDTFTGLIWQEHGTYGSYSRDYANIYVDQLSTGGHTNWRLPEYIEIYGIRDYITNRIGYTGGESYWVADYGTQGELQAIIFSNSLGIRPIFTTQAQIWAVRTPPWYSSDPNDFILLKNTVWEFEWEHNYIDYSDIVTFDANVRVSDNKMALPCHNDIWNGCVFYGDFPSSDGRGFICTLSDALPTNVFITYQFNVNNDTVIGDFVYLDLSDPSKFITETLIGTKISDIDQNQPIYQDQNWPIDQNQPVNFDPNQAFYFDQNQPINLINNPSSNDDAGGGCFISFLLKFWSRKPS